METKRKTNTKKKVTAITALAVALILLAGTFMWWSSESNVTNNLKLGYLDVTPVEKFPNGDVEPGIDLKKEVYVSNNGTADAAIRMSFNESIYFVEYDTNANALKMTFNAAPGLTEIGGAEALIVKYSKAAVEKMISGDSGYVKVAEAQGGKAKAYEKDLGEGEIDTLAVYELADGDFQIADYDKASGTFTYAYYVRNGASFGPALYGTANQLGSGTNGTADYEMNTFRNKVTLNLINSGTGQKWTECMDGYFYYREALKAGEVSEKLLDSVSFSTDLPDSWQGAKYVIDVQVESKQAVYDAVKDAWGTTIADMITGLKTSN